MEKFPHTQTHSNKKTRASLPPALWRIIHETAGCDDGYMQIDIIIRRRWWWYLLTAAVEHQADCTRIAVIVVEQQWMQTIFLFTQQRHYKVSILHVQQVIATIRIIYRYYWVIRPQQAHENVFVRKAYRQLSTVWLGGWIKSKTCTIVYTTHTNWYLTDRTISPKQCVKEFYVNLSVYRHTLWLIRCEYAAHGIDYGEIVRIDRVTCVNRCDLAVCVYYCNNNVGLFMQCEHNRANDGTFDAECCRFDRMRRRAAIRRYRNRATERCPRCIWFVHNNWFRVCVHLLFTQPHRKPRIGKQH